METAIGQKLLLAASNATKEAVLIAPFVKVDALRRVLEKIPATAAVTLIARWIPGEILAGVCDLEIFDLIEARPNAELFVHPLLHAKSYRFDDSVLIGSANLTSKALGWAYPSNLEILELAGEQSLKVQNLEKLLLATSAKVDASYRDEVARQVRILGQETTIHESFFEAHVPGRMANWLPKCRDPRRLWLVYADPDEARRRTVEAAYRAAVDDLVFLGPPVGLTLIEFRQFVADILDRLPIVTVIANRASMGLTESNAVELVAAHRDSYTDGYEASDQWEILREWLLEFFPDVYRRDSYPDAFRVARIVG